MAKLKYQLFMQGIAQIRGSKRIITNLTDIDMEAISLLGVHHFVGVPLAEPMAIQIHKQINDASNRLRKGYQLLERANQRLDETRRSFFPEPQPLVGFADLQWPKDEISIRDFWLAVDQQGFWLFRKPRPEGGLYYLVRVVVLPKWPQQIYMARWHTTGCTFLHLSRPELEASIGPEELHSGTPLFEILRALCRSDSILLTHELSDEDVFKILGWDGSPR